jgi:hypothetical protein
MQNVSGKAQVAQNNRESFFLPAEHTIIPTQNSFEELFLIELQCQNTE